MAESRITGTIYKTRHRDKNVCLRYLSCKMGKKKKIIKIRNLLDSGTRMFVCATYHVKWERKKNKNTKCTYES